MAFRFVDREDELKSLVDAVRRCGLIIVYGRRRVGKTRLLYELSSRVGDKVLYHLCIEEPIAFMLRKISAKLVRLFGDESLLHNPIRSLDEFFNYISDKDITVVFDEFPVLAKTYPRVIGLLQEFLDSERRGCVTVILCGSVISMMEDLVSYASPLYGRKVYTMKVEPLPFHTLRGFFPRLSWADLARTYSVTDGIPEYILWFDEGLSFEDNLRRNVLRKGSYLFEEAEQLLRYELRDLATYNAILEAIASGYTSFGEIRDRAGVDGSALSKYLSVLRSMGIVDYMTPVHLSYKQSLRARNRLYYIKDNYFNFYYRYIFPNKDVLELGLIDEVLEKVMRDHDSYMGFIFEKIAKDLITELSRKGYLPRFHKIGKYWSRDVEIDLVTISKDSVTLYEVKWRNLKELDLRRAFRTLQRKAEKTPWHGRKIRYGVVGKKIEDSKEKYVSHERIVLDLEDFNKIA